MNRKRKLFMSIVVIILILITGVVVWDGAFITTKYDISKDVYDDEKMLMSETEFKLIQAGIQSASSHNMQPWKVKIFDQVTFSLYADMEKILPVIDPENNQLLMSQGTFIGSVKEAANELGVKLSVQYAPLNMNEKMPLVATFTIMGDEKIKVDAISSATKGNKSDSTAFDVKKASSLMTDTLTDYEMIWIKDDRKALFQDYLRKGTLIEASNQDATEELLDIFRFTKWDKNKYRYGLSLNTISPTLRTFIEPIIGIISDWKSFGKSSISTFEQRMDNEEIYLVLAKKGPEAMNFVQLGEVITKLGLNVEGYTSRPAVQLIQPLQGIQEINDSMSRDFKIEGEVMLILGFTKTTDTYHESVRHPVMDVILEK